MIFKCKGDKAAYQFVDADCIGRQCFQPGMYQHRSPLSCGGSRNTGSPDSATCMQRAYRGCPEGPIGERIDTCSECHGEKVICTADAGAGHSDDLAEYAPCPWCAGAGQVKVVGLPAASKELARQRRAEGWRASR